MKIYKITDEKFRKYGRIVRNIDFIELKTAMESTPVPKGVIYEPCIESFQKLPVAKQLSDHYYGELPIQIGYCNGHNEVLNAVEYHRTSEINFAATDVILMLGLQADVSDDYTYDTGKMEAFYVPEGIAVEIFATTLHYAPCMTEKKGFQVAVVLPYGTNFPLEKRHGNGEDSIIIAKNKWLIGHKEGGLPKESHIGLIGKNLNINDYTL